MTTIPVLSLLVAALPAYLAGAVPFGLILGRVLRGVDIREHGSRNLGATNALRVLGAPIGSAVFALDFAKGWVPVYCAPLLASRIFPHGQPPDAQALAWCSFAAAVAAVLGHVFPVTLGFRGGKGVATGAGVLAALVPLATIAAIVAFALVVALTRYVSLGSIAAAIVLPVAVVAHERDAIGGRALPALVASVVISLVVLARHRGNAARFLRGEEPRLGARRSASEMRETQETHERQEAQETKEPEQGNTVGP